MLDPVVCATIRLQMQPQVCCQALIELRKFIEAQRQHWDDALMQAHSPCQPTQGEVDASKLQPIAHKATDVVPTASDDAALGRLAVAHARRTRAPDGKPVAAATSARGKSRGSKRP
jgi:hypothetical protein